MLRILKNKEGFSLIELMVVVAIIGILASVAVPQYSKFQNKAKQSEARVTLGSLFSVEKAYQVERDSYSPCLINIGFSAPAGQTRYSIGFGVDGSWNNGLSATNCTAANGVTNFSSTAGNPAVGVTANATANATSFTGEARANLGSASIDTWTMDQNGAVANTVQGI